MVWIFFLGIEFFGLQKLFEGWFCFGPHQIEDSLPVFLESEDGDSHNIQDPII